MDLDTLKRGSPAMAGVLAHGDILVLRVLARGPLYAPVANAYLRELKGVLECDATLGEKRKLAAEAVGRLSGRLSGWLGELPEEELWGKFSEAVKSGYESVRFENLTKAA